MENFNEGDLVECVDDSPNTMGAKVYLKNGVKYVINEIVHCPSCKRFGLDVGVPTSTPSNNFECPCGHQWFVNDRLKALFRPSRFRKLPHPAKEYRVVEVAKELMIEAKRTIKLTEKIDV